MPVGQYTSPGGGKTYTTYTITYGHGWYIIKSGGKGLKHVSTAAEMRVAKSEASVSLTRDTAVLDIDNNRGVEASNN